MSEPSSLLNWLSRTKPTLRPWPRSSVPRRPTRFGVDVLIVEARVDEAVDLDVGGLGAESETCKSRGKCDGKLGLHEGISFLL